MSDDVTHRVNRHTDLILPGRFENEDGTPINITGATLSVVVNGPLTATATITGAVAGEIEVRVPYSAAWLDGRLMWFQVVLTLPGGDSLGFPRCWLDVQ